RLDFVVPGLSSSAQSSAYRRVFHPRRRPLCRLRCKERPECVPVGHVRLVRTSSEPSRDHRKFIEHRPYKIRLDRRQVKDKVLEAALQQPIGVIFIWRDFDGREFQRSETFAGTLADSSKLRYALIKQGFAAASSYRGPTVTIFNDS